MNVEPERPRVPAGDVPEVPGDLMIVNARLRALINIGLELASEREVDRRLPTICRAARELVNATYATVGIVDFTDFTVRHSLTCGSDRSAEAHATDWVTPGEALSGILKTLVVERQTFRGRNPGGDPAHLQLPSLHPAVQAFLAVPITLATRVHGWICAVRNDGGSFSADDQQLLAVLAAQVGHSCELDQEVRERQEVESALRRERDAAQRYLDTADVILLALDLEGRITLVNRKGCELLGWTEQELIGRNFLEMCVPARLRVAITEKFHAVLGGDPAVVQAPVVTRDGGERLVQWHNTLLRDATGQVTSTFSSGADITHDALSDREYQVMRMIATGASTRQIAADLTLSAKTVSTYRARIFEKMRMKSPAEIAAYVVRNRLSG